MEGFDLQSTEVITKFLRNKDTSVADVYSFTTEKLFADKKDRIVYLPQREKFVLELLIDRISQSNKLCQSFKNSEKTWQLFNLAWDQCNVDQRLLVTRSKILAKLKFGEIFSKLLADIMESKLYENIAYMDAFSVTLSHFVHNLKIHLSDDQNIIMLRMLLHFVVSNKGYSQELKNRLLLISYFIFSLNNKNAVKYDNKHRSEFCRDCLANTIICIDTYERNDDLKNNLKTMVVKILFGSDDESNIYKFMEQFASVESNNVLTESQVVYLLTLLIPKVEIRVLEDIVKLLVEFYPYFSATLIKKVTDMNKTLSFDFLSSLVTKALASNTDEAYSLITSCIKRSPGVALHHAHDICSFCCTDSPHSLDLFKQLIDSYANTRELEDFFRQWAKVVEQHPNKIFESDEIINYVASKLISLSQIQLTRLVEEEVEIYKTSPERFPVFLLAVCKGFLKGVSGSIKNALSKSLIFTLNELKPMMVSLFSIDGDYSWKLKFYILTLFDIEDLEEEVTKLKSKKTKDDDYYFFTMLRIMEQECEVPSQKFLRKFTSYYTKKSGDDFKAAIFSRWFMVIEFFFSKDDIGKMVEQFIGSASEENLRLVLSNTLIQTQTKIITHFVDYFITHEEKILLLESVSVYALNKAQREKILNCLLNKVHHPTAITIINAMLKMPTYKSDLETKFESLITLAESEKFVIIKRIFKLHLQQPVESADYLNSLFKKLNKAFDAMKPDNCEDYHPHMKIAAILIKESESSKMETSRTTLISNSMERVQQILTQYQALDVDTTCELIDYLTNIGHVESILEPERIKEFVANIGNRYNDDGMVKQTLFKYVCSMKDIYSPQYIFALHIVLEKCALLEATDYYISYLANDDTTFTESWMNVIDSLNLSRSTDFKKYIELITLFMKHVQKPSTEQSMNEVHSLFVASVSTIFYKLKELGSDDNLVNVIDLVDVLKSIASTKVWLFTQYSMELIVAFVAYIASRLSATYNDKAKQPIYIDLCQILSSFILYQRRRLSNRHHLINTVYISLLRSLFTSSKEMGEEGGMAFERLVSNLCEPNTHNLQVKHSANMESKDTELNNVLSQIKAGLRKHIPILIFNYIKMYLQFHVDPVVKPYLDNSVYMMLDLLTLNELNYINKSLDQQGRLVFKNVYDDYKKFYKWNED